MKKVLLFLLLLTSYLFPQISGSTVSLGVPGIHQAVDNSFALGYNGSTKYLSVTPKYVQVGSNLLQGWDFNNWDGVWSLITNTTPNSFTTTGVDGKCKFILTVGRKYKVIIQGNTTATNFTVRTADGVGNTTIATGSGTYDFIADRTRLFICNQGAGTTTITRLELYEATGSLDQNGNNRIINSANSDFESATNWASIGNHSSSVSTEQKHGGSYSLKITSTGTGDATANYTSLPASKFDGIGAGKKYTAEYWVYSSVTQNINMSLGDITKTVNVTANTWTKIPYTFLATSNTVNQPLKIWASQASTVYVDDVYLGEYWPVTISGWFKTGASGSYQGLICKSDGGNSNMRGFYIDVASNNLLNFRNGDGNNWDIVITSKPVNDGKWHFFTLVCDKSLTTGTYKLYLDSVLDNSISTSNGININTTSVNIGKYSYTNNYYWSGQIGFIRFTHNYAYTQSDVANEYKRGLKFIPPQGQIVLQLDYLGTTSSEMLQDRSAVRNDAVGVNIDLTDRQRIIK